MKEYCVLITEILAKTVTVEADSAAQAREIVEREWNNGVHVLGPDNLMEATFTV